MLFHINKRLTKHGVGCYRTDSEPVYASSQTRATLLSHTFLQPSPQPPPQPKLPACRRQGSPSDRQPRAWTMHQAHSFHPHSSKCMKSMATTTSVKSRSGMTHGSLPTPIACSENSPWLPSNFVEQKFSKVRSKHNVQTIEHDYHCKGISHSMNLLFLPHKLHGTPFSHIMHFR